MFDFDNTFIISIVKSKYSYHKANYRNIKRYINLITCKFCFLIYIIIIIFLFQIFKIDSISNNEKNSENNIKVAFYCISFKYGGVERVTSILLNYLSKEKKFNLILITKKEIQEEEYTIPNNIKRISLSDKKINLIYAVKKENIDILIYNIYKKKEMYKLNRLKKTKVIYYNHSSYFLWIFKHIYNFDNSIYKIYKNCKYILSLIPLENDYLFKKWGINSIFINNPSTYEYDSIIPSNLLNNNIIMIGRGDDKSKRFTFGIRAMKFIIKEILDSKMNILSNNDKILDELIQSLELKNFVSIVGYQKNPEHYLRNSSLHIFPSICDTYPMVLSETKIFGIPTILCGLDYLALAKKGTIIIHDNDPYILAKESIKILKDKNYRKKLGFKARQSMQKIKNKFIIKKWIKLLLAIYNDNYNSSMFKNFEDNHIQITEKQANIILNYQLKLFQKIDDNLKDLTLEKLKSYSLK